jgi:hypothetical protein
METDTLIKDKSCTGKKVYRTPLKKSKKRDIITEIIEADATKIPPEVIETVIKTVFEPEEEIEIESIEPVESIDVIKPTKKLRKKSKASEREHYVNSKEFEERIRGYYTTGDIPDELANSINKIAQGLSFAPNFINYSYKDDMVGDAIVKMFSALKNKKFRLDSGFSPFSYFTTIAFHAFINRIKKEKKYHEAVNEYKEKVYMDTMQAGDGMGGAVYIGPHHSSDEPHDPQNY